MSLYGAILLGHSYLRWGVLLVGVGVFVRSLAAWSKSAAWARADERLQTLLLAFVDLQFLLGLLLFVWLSPLSAAFFADPGHAVHDHVLRFFGLEHATMMTLAVAVLHVGRARSKRADSPRLRHRRVWTSTALFLVLVCASVPWPGLRHGRPLLRTSVEGAAPARESVTSAACPSVYAARCAPCHGLGGHGDGAASAALKPPPRNFTAPAWQQATSDVRIRDIVHDGGFAHGLSAGMPPQPDLSPEQVQALLRCIRSFAEAR